MQLSTGIAGLPYTISQKTCPQNQIGISIEYGDLAV